MMPEIVFSLVFMLCIASYIIFMKKKVDKHFKLHTTTWSNTLLSFVEKNGLTDIDIEFKSIDDIKKKSNIKESIIFVGKYIPKGYDFIDSLFEKGYSFSSHKHHYSSTFIYVLNGELEVSLGDNELDKLSNIQVQRLLPGDFIFIGQEKYHSLLAIKKTRCIIIALPPMSRGIL